MSTTTASPPADRDVLRHRPRLLGLAYRMLGDMDDAEDVVQEGYLRWHQAPRDDVQTPEAWLVTVVTRLAVDRLRRAATERATYVGPWLPEPVAVEPPSTLPAPDRNVELASDLSIALLVLLERLAPEERAAFLLREVFGTEYAEIARILDRRQDAVRQMVHRARTRVQADRPRVPVEPDAHERLLESFMGALQRDDAPAMLALLAPEVTLTSDGGGRAAAATRPIFGADRVMRFLLGVGRKFGDRVTHRMARLNGAPALLTFYQGTLITAWMPEIVDGRVVALYVMRNPDKLRRAADGDVDIS